MEVSLPVLNHEIRSSAGDGGSGGNDEEVVDRNGQAKLVVQHGVDDVLI